MKLSVADRSTGVVKAEKQTSIRLVMEGGVYGSCQKSDTKLEGADCQGSLVLPKDSDY